MRGRALESSKKGLGGMLYKVAFRPEPKLKQYEI